LSPEYEVLKVEGVSDVALVNGHLLSADDDVSDTGSSSRKRHKNKRNKHKKRKRRHLEENAHAYSSSSSSSINQISPRTKRLKLIVGDMTHTIDFPIES
jgi:hypothetical protein